MICLHLHRNGCPNKTRQSYFEDELEERRVVFEDLRGLPYQRMVGTHGL